MEIKYRRLRRNERIRFGDQVNSLAHNPKKFLQVPLGSEGWLNLLCRWEGQFVRENNSLLAFRRMVK